MENDADPASGRQAGEAFVQLLTAEQLKLLHYIAKLLGNPNEAHNILQETNLVLWRKAAEFRLGTNFSAWAHNVAYWQVRAFVRDRHRDRLVFSEELIEQLTSRDERSGVDADMRVALRHCLSQTSGPNLELLRQRYEAGLSIQALADRQGKKTSAVKVNLLRIRRALLKCIQAKLSPE
jgi:RNA polymerase sigma-70 factor, ECF subfamily